MVTTRRASKAKAQVDSMGLFRVLADAEIGVIADLLPQDAAGRLESTCSGLLRVVRSQRSRLALPSVAASVKGLERCDVVDGWLAALERYPLASYVDGSSVRDDVFDILLVGLGAALSAGRFKVIEFLFGTLSTALCYTPEASRHSTLPSATARRPQI